jgi:trk system potassium uptake protein TrkA
MRIIIIGAGEVGTHLAEELSRESHDIVLIDEDVRQAQTVQDRLDIMVLEGNGASPKTLQEAGIAFGDLLLAVTNRDEINLLACVSAAQYAVPFRIARVSDMDFYMLDHWLEEKGLAVDLIINPEFECAMQVHNLLQVPGASDFAQFSGGQVVLFGLDIPQEAPCIGRKLREIRLEMDEFHFLAVSITRNGSTIIPSGNTMMEPNDRVFFVSQRGNLDEVFSFCGRKREKVRRVMILGGSKTARYLCQILEKQDVFTTLIVENEDEARALAGELSHTLILHGNANDFDLLKQEGLSTQDAFLALTKEDESNMLAGLVAREAGVPVVIAHMTKVAYLPLVQKLGVTAAVSPRMAVVNSILKYVRSANIATFAKLQNNQAEITEFIVGEASRLIGTPLHELALPKDVLLAMIHRQREDFIPTGFTTLEAGDRVVTISLSYHHRKLEKMFQ